MLVDKNLCLTCKRTHSAGLDAFDECPICAAKSASITATVAPVVAINCKATGHKINLSDCCGKVCKHRNTCAELLDQSFNDVEQAYGMSRHINAQQQVVRS